ncbi:MAG: PINc/VapC family ATPase [Methanobrevibacter ruminantium]|uniref:PINc/VapC family ATPase n=1 Tax=Methanobrevibacter ruminantium TaxID=83816 RepID=UPI0026EE0CCF|nr:PINc/VapC family ATPase [Methanobrevibacter ruminantium]MDD6049226.1 PINc/VapC family ATPase [Methanobrevibacter ruminantium]
MKRIVPDTSAIIEGNVEKIIKEKELNYPEIIIPEAVISELEHQANNQRPTGIRGLENVKKLQDLAEIGEISIKITGRRPTKFEKDNAKLGEIDGLIRDVAKDELALLLTSDKIQAKTAEAQGIPTIYYAQEYKGAIDLKIAKFFDDDTMSVHLKENVVPMAKKGKPGHIELVKLADEKFTYKQLEAIAEEILEKERYDAKTYLEVDKQGAIVVQSRDLRISIARPPFSEALEITAVRPVAEVSLDQYHLSSQLIERLTNSARGILISGSPGAGKSTFAQAIAKFYDEYLNKVVKTMESPRDLQVGDTITQYAPLEGDMENTADILLLVRPDFTIYDELRKNHDFKIFADMRLAGVGMIGVVHATRPIDAIQRIASRVDLGTIPSIVDTTIYIEDGEISAIYENKLTVKVPSGMEERDLARPVIEVRDFETGTLVNEIYTYGEQTIVMDIGMVEQSKKAKMNQEKTPVQMIAEREILRTLKKITPKAAIEVSMESDRRVNIYITEKYIPKIIGKGGKRIAELENEIGISMNVEPLEKAPDSFAERLSKKSWKSKSKKAKKDKHKKSKKSQLKEYNDNIDNYLIDEGKKDYSNDNYYDLSEESDEFDDYEEGETSEFYYEVFELYPEIRKDHIVLPIGKKYVGSAFDILLEDKYLFTATVGKRGYVKLHKNLDLTEEIIDGLDKGLRVIARVRD